MNRIALVILLVVSLGCASSSNHESLATPGYLNEKASETAYKVEKYDLDEANSAFTQGNYELSKQKYLSFLNHFPQSLNLSEALYGLGLSHEGLSDWTAASQMYLQLAGMKLSGSESYPARAFYRLSFCYESLGDLHKAILALQDAERMKNQLPLEIALAELPGRMAALYAGLGEVEVANKYMLQAEAAIQRLKGLNKNVSGDWLGASLIQMGRISLNQISTESFAPTVQSMQKSQKYLLQAVTLNDAKWSPKAQQEILQNYEQLYRYIKVQKISYSDHQRGLVETGNLQAEMAAELLSSLEVLKSYASSQESKTSIESRLFEELNPVEEDLKKILLGRLYLSPLTPEAEKLQNSKRNLKLKDLTEE